jgi:amidohydrolase
VISGRGGHGAAPQETIDSTLIASQIVVAWQSIISRNIDPTQTAVLSIGTFHSGDLFNVISGRAVLTGTIRTFDPAVEELLKQRMREVAEGVSRSFGATCQLDFEFTVPATVNSKSETLLMERVAGALVGPEQITQITPMMVGEDMSEFLNRVPGCFVIVGAALDDLDQHGPHHSPTFSFDERMLPTGVALLASAATTYLAERAADQL